MIPFSRNLLKIIDEIYSVLKLRSITSGLIKNLVQKIAKNYNKTIFVYCNLFDNQIGKIVKSIKSDLN